MKKILSTQRWHNTKISNFQGCFVLCHLQVERIFVMLVRLQSWNLHGRSPSCVPNEPFEFMNCRFDLKNSFFSSTTYFFWKPQFLQITSNGPQTAYTHTQVTTAVSDLYFCCLNRHILILHEGRMFSHTMSYIIMCQYKFVLDDKFKAWAACGCSSIFFFCTILLLCTVSFFFLNQYKFAWIGANWLN